MTTYRKVKLLSYGINTLEEQERRFLKRELILILTLMALTALKHGWVRYQNMFINVTA